MMRRFTWLMTLALFGLAVGLPIGAHLRPAAADEQYCCCETDCRALGTCEKSYQWSEIDECASDVYCARTCTDSPSSVCRGEP